MVSLLSFAKQKVQQVGNVVGNDIAAPVSHAIGNTVNAAATTARDVGGAAQATGRFVTATPNHNVIAPFVVNNFVKPLAQFPLDAGDTLYNRAVAPTFNLPHIGLNQSPLKVPSNAVGANGSLHQTIGSGIQTGLTIGTAGLDALGEKGATAAAGFIAPNLAREAALKTALGLGEEAIPQAARTAIKYGSGALTGATAGGIVNSGSGISAGHNAKQILTKDLPLGVASGAGLGIGGQALSDAAGKVANLRTKPVNDENGAIGKGVNASNSEQTAKQYFANNAKATADYQAHTMQEFGTSKPNIVSGDSAKFIVDGGGTLDPTHSAPYHEPASAFAKDYYKKLLADPTTKNEPVLITGGGAGAGKTTALKLLAQSGEPLDKYAAVNDTNLTTVKSATDRIDQALKSGRKVRVAYTYRDPVDAFTNGNVSRAAQTGRIVPIASHVDTHVGSLNTIKQIAEKYRGNPNVDIRVIDNSRGAGNATFAPNGVDFLKDKVYNKDNLTKVLQNELETAKANKTITPEAYSAYKEGLGPSAGGEPQPQRPNGQVASFADKPMTPVGVIAKERVDALKSGNGITEPPGVPVKGVVGPGKVVTNRLTQGARDERQNLTPETVSQVQGEHAVRSTAQLKADAEAGASSKTLDKVISDAHTALSVPAGHIDDKTVAAVQQAIEHADAAGRTADAVALHDSLSAHLVKQGQSIQAASLLYRMSPQGLRYKALKMLKEGKANITPELTDQVKTATDKVKQTEPGTNERAFAVQDLQKIVNNNVQHSKLDKAFTLWRTGLLTGPLTATKVGASHVLMNVAEKAKDLTAVALDKVIAPFSGVRSTSFTARGTLGGAKEGLTAAGQLLRHGHDTPGSSAWSGAYDELGNPQTAYGTSKLGTAANFYTQKVGQVHAAIPKPFYRSAYENDLYKQANAAAATQKLSGADKADFVNQFVAKPSEKADQSAHLSAQYATFQQPTFLGKASSAFQKAPGGRALAPFAHIASAILTDVKNYSPIGAMQTVFDAAKASRGGWTPQIQKQLVEGVGRGVTGTGIAALGAELYKQGKITTGYPTDKKEAALWKATGKQENSILIGGKWRQTPALGPFGSLLAAGALLQSSKGSNAKGKSNAGAALTGALSNISSQSYLSGLTQGAAALNNPTENAKSFLKLEAGSVVPVGIGQVATATDKDARTANSVGGAVESKIPGLREHLPASQDAFGRTVTNQNNPATSLLDPTKPTNVTNNPVTTELQRLVNTTGTAGVPVPLPVTKVSGKDTNGKSVSIPLNPAQQSQFTSIAGPQMKAALAQVIKSAGYAKLDDDSKATALTNAKTDVENMVKAQMFDSLQSGGSSSTLTGGAKALANGTPVNYVANAQTAADKDTFAASGDNFGTSSDGKTIFQRDAAGNVTSTPKIQYDYSVGTATLTQQKDAGDLNGWLGTAQSQLQNISTQLKDPSTTPLQALTLKNDASSLNTDIAKYTSYGAFKKGSSSGSSSFKTAGFKTAKAPKAPKGVKIAKVKTPSFKTAGTKKLSVSKIPSNYLSKKLSVI